MDDAVLYMEGDTTAYITDCLQIDLDKLVEYCDVNQLTINADETKSMLYTYDDNLLLGELKEKKTRSWKMLKSTSI